jgi:hypothetical protein
MDFDIILEAIMIYFSLQKEKFKKIYSLILNFVTFFSSFFTVTRFEEHSTFEYGLLYLKNLN